VDEVETAVGALLLPRADQMITQVLRDAGIWEPPETRYFRAILRPGQTFVDVGAHVGYFSVLAAKCVGPTGTVIAIEPEARNLDLLHRNLARNRCTNSLVVPFAAHSMNGSMSLALDEENRGGHRLVPLGLAATTVRCARLDELLPDSIDVVKIDVQGYDHEVIAGLERTLAANPQMIVVAELSLSELDRRGLKPEVVLAGYEALGFTIAIFDAGGRAHRVAAEDVLAKPRPADFSLILERRGAPTFSARDLNARPRIAGGLEINEAPDGVIVFQSSRNRVHQLNHTAAVVFDLCTGKHTIAQIVALTKEVFELSDPPTAEVQGCVERLSGEGLVI
jgi:FkbM family methyltransferase